MTKAYGSTRAILLLSAAILCANATNSAAGPQDPTVMGQIAPGITYLYYGDAETRFHAIVIDRSYSQYELRVLAHRNETNDLFTSHSIAEFAELSEPGAIAAINGWYWSACAQAFWTNEWKRCKGFSQWDQVKPQQTIVLDNNVVNAPGAAPERIMGFSQSFGGPSASVGIMQFHSQDWMSPPTWPFMHYARGSTYNVLVNGQCNANLGTRDKRSAIGYSETKIVMLSSDQTHSPRDADISDLCWFFALHGIQNANLLDGGPSAQMYVRALGAAGAPANPLEAGGQWYPAGYRFVSDAIAVVKVCQADGEQCGAVATCCNGLSCEGGVCGQAPPPPACVDDGGCLTSQHCALGSCVADVCSQGAHYCSGLQHRLCNPNGSTSSLVENCAFACSAGACSECAGDNNCASTEFCSAGQCLADLCAQGDLFCSSNDRRQCNLNGSGSSFIETCMFSCANGQCQPQCAGDASCAGSQYCSAGSCLQDVCTQGAIFCSGSDRWLCNINGSNSSFVDTCTTSCVNGSCTSPAPVALAMNLSTPWQLTIDNDYVYWVEKVSNGALRRVPKTGGPVQTLATGLPEPTAVVVDASYAYVLERNGGDNGRIDRVPILGGPVELVAGGLSNAQNFMVQDAMYLYLSDQSSLIGGMMKRVRKATNTTADIIVQGNGLANVNPAIAIDASYMYFRNDVGRFLRAPLGGGAVTDLGIVPILGAMHVSGATVYFPAGTTNVGGGWIGSMSTAGGIPTTIISGRTTPANVVFDGSYIYWTESNHPGGVFRVDTAGGNLKTYSNSTDSIGIAVDASYVYWTNAAGINSGQIMRAAK